MSGVRLVRFEAADDGRARIGRLESGAIRELPYGDMRSALAAYMDADLDAGDGGELFELDAARILAPLPDPGKIICIGLNYRDHAAEIGQPLPNAPILFSKYANTIVGPRDAIVRGSMTSEVDYEAELGVVIGRRARNVGADAAIDYVGGYMNVNDVSARDLQFSAGAGQWTLGKSLDTFAPTGPFLATRDAIDDPQDLAISCTVNGTVVQSSNTGEMIFGVRQLIEWLSRYMTLELGDVIATGTPAGVGMAADPPRYLEPGDVVTVEIAGLGELTNDVVR